jgi:hypothetical protein
MLIGTCPTSGIMQVAGAAGSWLAFLGRGMMGCSEASFETCLFFPGPCGGVSKFHSSLGFTGVGF